MKELGDCVLKVIKKQQWFLRRGRVSRKWLFRKIDVYCNVQGLEEEKVELRILISKYQILKV